MNTGRETISNETTSSAIKNHGKIGEAIGKLTLEELAAQSFLFFLVGKYFKQSKTLITTLGFALYELALNPDIQDNLRDDIRSVL